MAWLPWVVPLVLTLATSTDLTAPGTSGTVNVTNADGNSVLSIVGMILPSNDGFIGLDNWTIPQKPVPTLFT